MATNSTKKKVDWKKLKNTLLENSWKEAIVEDYLSKWLSKERASSHEATSGVRFTSLPPEDH